MTTTGRAILDPHAREREARDEMARTRVGTGVTSVLVGVALLVLLAGCLPELLAMAGGRSALTAPLPTAPTPESTPGGLLAGPAARVDHAVRVAREIERRFGEESRLARAIRPWGQRVLLRGLRYGNEEVYTGRDGWLHFRADFDHLTRTPPAPGFDGDPAAVIEAWRDALAARGVALLVVPTPVKLTIEPDSFAGQSLTALAPIRSAADRQLLAALERAEVPFVDLAQRLFDLRAGGRHAYLERDTHWLPEAMDSVARTVAVELRGLVELPPGDPERFRATATTAAGRGDLTALLGLRPEDEPPVQQVAVQPVWLADGGAWRPERGAPVLLLGDSFSAIYALPELGWGSGAGLAERLAFHLGLPVDRLVRNAGGASATRTLLAAELAREPTRLDGVQVVVWQFAARELTGGDWRRIELPTD